MGSFPGVTDAAASLLETDPSLARSLGPNAAATVGHQPILAVLEVAAGPWEPPEPRQLGGGIVAFVVLEGLLAAGTPICLVGPGDVLRPWEGGVAWTACTPVRLALVGTEFVDALAAWPGASAKVLERALASRPLADAGAVDERALDLLWRLAGLWGVPRGEGIGLPRTLDAGALAGLLQVSERRAEAAVALLSALGHMHRGDGSGWLMPMAPAGPRTGYSRQRRDDLRSRQAHQMAVAREVRSEHSELSAQSQAQIAASRRRRDR
jgi:hypothetical protein